jgi:hypothetical protein
VPAGTFSVCAIAAEQSFILLFRQSQLFRYCAMLHWLSGRTKHPCGRCTQVYNNYQLGNFQVLPSGANSVSINFSFNRATENRNKTQLQHDNASSVLQFAAIGASVIKFSS